MRTRQGDKERRSRRGFGHLLVCLSACLFVLAAAPVRAQSAPGTLPAGHPDIGTMGGRIHPGFDQGIGVIKISSQIFAGNRILVAGGFKKVPGSFAGRRIVSPVITGKHIAGFGGGGLRKNGTIFKGS